MSAQGIVFVAMLLLSAPAAWAGEDDVVCHRTAEESQASTAVDVTTVLGTQQGCVVRGAARSVCSRAEGSVCYRIECADTATASVRVTDRFGTRRVAVEEPRLLCLSPD